MQERAFFMGWLNLMLTINNHRILMSERFQTLLVQNLSFAQIKEFVAGVSIEEKTLRCPLL